MNNQPLSQTFIRDSNTEIVDFLNSILNEKPTLSRAEMDAIQLNRARRMAKRKRAEIACQPCKFKKARCNDSRPCRRCLHSNVPEDCTNVAGNRNFHADAISEAGFCTKNESSALLETFFVAQSRAPSSLAFLPFASLHQRLPVYMTENPTHPFPPWAPTAVKQSAYNHTSISNSVEICSPSIHIVHPSEAVTTLAPTQQNVNSYHLYDSISHAPISHATTGLGDGWAWEAAPGPGEEDPFRED